MIELVISTPSDKHLRLSHFPRLLAGLISKGGCDGGGGEGIHTNDCVQGIGKLPWQTLRKTFSWTVLVGEGVPQYFLHQKKTHSRCPALYLVPIVGLDLGFVSSPTPSTYSCPSHLESIFPESAIFFLPPSSPLALNLCFPNLPVRRIAPGTY